MQLLHQLQYVLVNHLLYQQMLVVVMEVLIHLFGLLVVLVKQRKAGSHAPDMKTQRQKANIALRKQIKKTTDQ